MAAAPGPMPVSTPRKINYPSWDDGEVPDDTHDTMGYPPRTMEDEYPEPIKGGVHRDGSGIQHPIVLQDDTPAAPGIAAVGPAEKPLTVYAAEPFNAPEQEADMLKGPLAGPVVDETAPFIYFQRQTEIHWYGWAAMIFYLCSLGFYLWVRITKTLNLGPGYIWYGIYLLAVEILGATTVVLYGINLLWNPVIEQFPEDPESPGKPKTRLPYHVRVLVPCYKEDLEILRRTVLAAHDAILPNGCQRTIYMCDDGKDPKKRKWCESMGPEIVYVSGRVRPPGEMNGKSGNMNNCLGQIYPKEHRIPGNEVVCVFDADQVAKKDFFLKTLPFFDAGDDIGMVLSPQCFHNLNLHEDIFNHSNIHFWEYMQPGYDALGFISCTGTNFLVRAQAIMEVGGSPGYTMTEDYALGMEMKKFGWHCRYVQEYLAIGEAPHEVRNMYQQRSRWTKGHFQIMFNPKVSPLFQRKLSWPMRIMYCSGVWSYLIGAISTPTFIIIPLVTIWVGVFPISIDGRKPHWIALAMSIQTVATHLVLYYVRHPNHAEALWFANVANQLLWWTYIKACWRAFTSKICCSTITFKATAKGPGKLKDSAVRDLWLPGLCFALLFISSGVAIWQLFSGVDFFSPLTISLLWAIYNAIPPFLILFYAAVGRGFALQFVCKFCFVLTFAAGISAIALIWAIKSYNVREFGGGLSQSEDMGVLFRYIHNLGSQAGNVVKG